MSDLVLTAADLVAVGPAGNAGGANTASETAEAAARPRRRAIEPDRGVAAILGAALTVIGVDMLSVQKWKLPRMLGAVAAAPRNVFRPSISSVVRSIE